jgi:uncharacterized membrane protein YhaH (DUF805 family)
MNRLERIFWIGVMCFVIGCVGLIVSSTIFDNSYCIGGLLVLIFVSWLVVNVMALHLVIRDIGL